MGYGCSMYANKAAPASINVENFVVDAMLNGAKNVNDVIAYVKTNVANADVGAVKDLYWNFIGPVY
jgi:hypothetical protein